MKYLIVVLILTAGVLSESSFAANNLELPSWASSGNLENEMKSKGQEATEILSIIVVLLAIGGMVVGAGFLAVGNQEKGKQFLFGGIIGLIVAGSVYGIAAIFIG